MCDCLKRAESKGDLGPADLIVIQEMKTLFCPPPWAQKDPCCNYRNWQDPDAGQGCQNDQDPAGVPDIDTWDFPRPSEAECQDSRPSGPGLRRDYDEDGWF